MCSGPSVMMDPSLVTAITDQRTIILLDCLLIFFVILKILCCDILVGRRTAAEQIKQSIRADLIELFANVKIITFLQLSMNLNWWLAILYRVDNSAK